MTESSSDGSLKLFSSTPLARGQYFLLLLGVLAVELVLRILLLFVSEGTLPDWDLVDPLLLPHARSALNPLGVISLVGAVVLAIPVAWILAVLSTRRAVDAGTAPWVGIVVLFPYVGIALVLFLLIAPSRTLGAEPRAIAGARVWPNSIWFNLTVLLIGAGAYLAFAAGTTYAEAYGATLFFCSPILLGAGLGFALTISGRPRGEVYQWVALISFALPFLLILVALEGAVCVAMTLPIVVPLALIGASIGRMFVVYTPETTSSFGVLVLLLPLSGGLETYLEEPVHRVVLTSVEIDASPERVWENVIRFGDLPEPEGFLFETGIAYPIRARLEGEGVGAIRYCEFSTGPFVEPITAWEPPHRLAFDVTAQPHPMEEWSFYSDFEPPHLERSFRSTRGEFRLIALPNGRTRLEGRTWYQLDIAPVAYWQLWTDWILHRIHLRVLEHIQDLSER